MELATALRVASLAPLPLLALRPPKQERRPGSSRGVDLDGTAIGDRTLRYRMRVLRRCSAGRETSRDNCLFIAAGPSRSESRRERFKVWKSIGHITRWPGVTTSTKGTVPDLSRGYAMPNRSALTIGFVLRALFCAMLVLIISLLLLPIDGDLRQRADSAEVARTAHAARLIFEALQNLRLERGPTRTTLEGKEPASVEFLSLVNDLRAKSQPALAAVVEECGVVDCVGPKAGNLFGIARQHRQADRD
jgi:hypothetical protein